MEKRLVITFENSQNITFFHTAHQGLNWSSEKVKVN